MTAQFEADGGDGLGGRWAGQELAERVELQQFFVAEVLTTFDQALLHEGQVSKGSAKGREGQHQNIPQIGSTLGLVQHGLFFEADFAETFV